MLFALRMMRNEKWSTSRKNRQKIGAGEKVGVDFSEGRGDPFDVWPKIPRIISDFAAVRETACRIRPAMTTWPSEADGGMISG